MRKMDVATMQAAPLFKTLSTDSIVVAITGIQLDLFKAFLLRQSIEYTVSLPVLCPRVIERFDFCTSLHLKDFDLLTSFLI